MNLEYLSWVINEVLRLYPPLPRLFHTKLVDLDSVTTNCLPLVSVSKYMYVVMGSGGGGGGKIKIKKNYKFLQC